MPKLRDTASAMRTMEEFHMVIAKWLCIVFVLILFTTVSCSQHHRGRPGMSGDSRMQEVVPEVKELVEQNVKDPEKAKQVQAMVQNIVNEVRKSGQQVRGYHEQLAALNADYNARPEQFTKILDELTNSRMESAAKILQMRFKIKDMLTADEWKNLNDAMIKSRRAHEKGMAGGMPGTSGGMQNAPPATMSGY
jgi:predicted KAP-like P-loop ATPase